MAAWKDMTPEQRERRLHKTREWRKTPKSQEYRKRTRDNVRGSRARGYMLKSDFMQGYMQGDNERQWLAQANSDLRSRILELEQYVSKLEDDVAVDDLDSYCGAWWLGWPAILLVVLASAVRRTGHAWRALCIRIYFCKVSLETAIARAFTRMARSHAGTGRDRHLSGRASFTPTPGVSSDFEPDDDGRVYGASEQQGSDQTASTREG